MKDFRGPLPLTDADFAAIRRNVLASLEPRPRRVSFAFRFAFATVVAAFAGIFAWTPYIDRNAPHVGPPLRRSRPAESRPYVAAAITTPQPDPPSPSPRRKPRRAPAPPAPQPIYIELQTSDPDVRIIWIANQPASPSEEKS